MGFKLKNLVLVPEMACAIPAQSLPKLCEGFGWKRRCSCQAVQDAGGLRGAGGRLSPSGPPCKAPYDAEAK
jgi:hypothetical protein